MSGLADFITARLGEDEAMARSASPGQWAITDDDVDGTMITAVNGPVMAVYGTGVTPAALPNAAHIARHDPARVLREVTAKRAMVALHAIHSEPERWGSGHPDLAMRGQPTGRTVYWCDECDHDRDYGHIGIAEVEGCTTMRLLAAPYSDHPDYRAEWAPAL